MKKKLFKFLCWAVLIPGWAGAITIENRSPHPALITVKNEDFEIIDKERIEPEQSIEYVVENKESRYNIEAYILDPQDHTGVPTFFHKVGPKEKLCIPQHLCVRKKKK